MVSDNSGNQAAEQLGAAARRLTSDQELQKDLVQEMTIHLDRMRTSLPGQTEAWYLKSCEFQARNYLRRGRSIDSLKRAGQVVGFGSTREPAASLDWPAEVMTAEVVSLVQSQLTERQRQVFALLLEGYGVRAAARKLGVSHPAIIKHRRKIARAARKYLPQPQPKEISEPASEPAPTPGGVSGGQAITVTIDA